MTQLTKETSIVLHYRFLDVSHNISPQGGVTVVYLPAENIRSFGVSLCSPVDNFCKQKGIAIATQRAMQAFKIAGVRSNGSLQTEYSLKLEADETCRTMEQVREMANYLAANAIDSQKKQVLDSEQRGGLGKYLHWNVMRSWWCSWGLHYCPKGQSPVRISIDTELSTAMQRGFDDASEGRVTRVEDDSSLQDVANNQGFQRALRAAEEDFKAGKGVVLEYGKRPS